MISKFAIIGPESSGKSTLAAQLATSCQSLWVPEFAREYLHRLDRPYTQADLLNIATGQLALEAEYAANSTRLLICDTNLLVIKVWSEVKYGTCDPWIMEQMRLDTYKMHLLTAPDIPWEYDSQREHPYKREELFLLYEQELTQSNIPFRTVRGTPEERLKQTRMIVEEIMKNGD